MAQETILQHWIVTKFALPFLLMFVIIFAVLEKTKLLGDNKQVNAIVAFVIGLIFVGVAYPKDVVSNMVLFLTVAIVVLFVALLLWGFIAGQEMKGNILKDAPAGLKWVIGIAVVLAVVIGLLWASGIENTVFDLFFRQTWSEMFWTNFAFVVVIIAALALIIGKK